MKSKMALRISGYRGTTRCLLLMLSMAVVVNVWIIIVGIQPRLRDDKSRGSSDEAKGIKSRGELEPDSAPDQCPYWCYGLPSNVSLTQDETSVTGRPTYFLTAVISVRVYDWKDLAQLGSRELRQWLRYLSLAGVEHVYLYDAYAFKNESQESELRDFIDSGYLTYADWHHLAVPFSLARTQVAAYIDCLERWGELSAWQVGIDMDEYPFCPTDRDPGFLTRYLKKFDSSSPDAVDVSELSMQNYLYLGKPLDVAEHPLLIDRIWRRTKQPANHLVKPIYRPAAVKWRDIHMNSLRHGTRKTLPDTELRMNHYWGARLQNWGDDTQEILDKTVEDRSMEPIVRNLNRCSSCKPR